VICSVPLGIRTKYKWKYNLSLFYILVIRTKYELHSFVVSVLIWSNYLGRRKKLSCRPVNDSLFADCALNELCFPFKICPVMENMHSTLTDDALLVSTIIVQCCTSKQSETVKPAACFILSFRY